MGGETTLGTCGVVCGSVVQILRVSETQRLRDSESQLSGFRVDGEAEKQRGREDKDHGLFCATE